MLAASWALVDRRASFLEASSLVCAPPSVFLERMTPPGRADDPPRPRRGIPCRSSEGQMTPPGYVGESLFGRPEILSSCFGAHLEASWVVLGPSWRPPASSWQDGDAKRQKGEKTRKSQQKTTILAYWGPLKKASGKLPLGAS